uniref:Uncharacterized protein n=1 Tax=Nelumbo nucifera TaxID=4432 RepID=A0A822Z939_NELNU|nr:TPA_asm: hypothetical protein HUJ06_015423 [Nelumbo nucifera]
MIAEAVSFSDGSPAIVMASESCCSAVKDAKCLNDGTVQSTNAPKETYG